MPPVTTTSLQHQPPLPFHRHVSNHTHSYHCRLWCVPSCIHGADLPPFHAALLWCSRFVEGQDARDVELMWDQMFRSTLNYGRKGLPLQVGTHDLFSLCVQTPPLQWLHHTMLSRLAQLIHLCVLTAHSFHRCRQSVQSIWHFGTFSATSTDSQCTHHTFVLTRTFACMMQ